MDLSILVGIVILIFSIVLHEVAHGYAANWLGDPTARLAGRLTLNPLRHIDPLGSVFIPAVLVLTGSPILFGYAKPVPYNLYNLRAPRFGEAMVAGAGPFTNVLLAILSGLLVRFAPMWGASSAFVEVLSFAVYINIFLALFNLVPIPPLDGSKVLAALLPASLYRSYEGFRERVEAWGSLFGFILIIGIFYVFSPVFTRIVSFFYTLCTGL